MDQPENQEPKTSFFASLASGFLFLWDFLKIILVALVIIVPIRYFVFQPFIVSGSSMEPNFQSRQYLIIDELSYHFTAPQRGQVVVLHYPKDPKQYFIKRIIGLPGEKVEIDNGRVMIFNAQNPGGVTLDESYLPSQNLTYPHDINIIGGQKILTLGPDQYFMMGDNRLASSDSRDWGILPRSEMVGRVLIRVLPVSAFRLFNSVPTYSF